MTATLPAGYRLCVCGCASRGNTCRCGRSLTPATPANPATRHTGPNATELEAASLLPGDWQYEARKFDILGGATYTPDWVDLARLIAIEAKGEFIHSRDSRRRFDEARHLRPDWTWIWARKRAGRKGSRWEIEWYPSKTNATASPLPDHHASRVVGAGGVGNGQPQGILVRLGSLKQLETPDFEAKTKNETCGSFLRHAAPGPHTEKSCE
jgi:hypothetical protein